MTYIAERLAKVRAKTAYNRPRWTMTDVAHVERAALIADRADWLVTVIGPDAPHLELTRAERKAWAKLVDALRSSGGGEGEKTA